MRFFKNKKGATVIETIMLFPFAMYLILFTTFKLISYTAISNAYQLTTDYTRAIIVCKTGEEAFNKLAYHVYDKTNEERHTKTNDSITSIKITRKGSTDSITFTFDMYKEGSNTFANFCSIKDGIVVFDYMTFENKNSNAKLINNYWSEGSLIEITVRRDLTTDVLKDALSFRLYDFSTGESKVMTMGINTDVKVSASNVISI